ncbi:hypothetical protein PHYSODRAFT_324096 [Phytophthora sojae]|uniref:Uncharacterized protein n=1 Tax=Phytophthora sojae (strain P6497) TaxID=1094619 RepID=G4Z0U6_PHYSP|nr:hypothetical protein PHYSODRAFT_324096 [Phytophthora sojae]EGZ22785.1 hypothetical protein PHYSODRAFT_324096 [Phytophthora sojae]|eukprot:XP_009518073.1 hypothetical protein PHYSODRAFT_324096 [Phytophthora sojae]
MRESTGPQSPLTPQSLTPVVTAGYSTKLWDARAPKYSKNVMRSVCIFLLALTFCEELSGYGVNQSLKNFFQKLEWSNKGSNSMKLTYDSLSQFACIAAAFIADQFLGKYRTLLGATSFSPLGFVLIMIAALPSVLENQMLNKVLFCVGLFLGIALNQVGMSSLLVSFGGDQYSPDSPPEQRDYFFSMNLFASNVGVAINYAVFPSLIIATFLPTRSRYVHVPPSKSALASVIHVVVRSAARNFRAKMIVLGTIMYIVAFLLNIVAAFMSDDGEVGQNISYVCGVLIVAATVLWIYYAQDPSFIDGATDSNDIEFDRELIEGVKQVILILPFNAFNTFWWVCQNQRGNNQTIIQQTDYAGKPPSVYGKVAAGYVVAIISMVWTGVFEIIRRNSPVLVYLDADGVTQVVLNKNGGEPMNDIPWYAAIPQYVLVATATVLIQIPTYNVGYDKVPMGLRSVTIALGLFINSMGSTLPSVIVLLFGKYIPANLNDGHMEYMYFAIAAVMILNTVAYVVVMQNMQFGMIPRLGKNSTEEEEEKEVPASKLSVDRRSVN